MKTRIICFVTALILSGALVQTTLAGDRGQRMMERITEDLGLTTEQASSLQAIFEAKKADRESMKQSHQEIDALIESGDSEAAAELAAQNARERVLERAELMSQVKAILTAEQFEEWKEMKQNHKHRGPHRGGM